MNSLRRSPTEREERGEKTGERVTNESACGAREKLDSIDFSLSVWVCVLRIEWQWRSGVYKFDGRNDDADAVFSPVLNTPILWSRHFSSGINSCFYVV